MLKQKIEYFTAILLSLALLEFGFSAALSWHWSKFPWSPLGVEECGLEFLAMLVLPVIDCHGLGKAVRRQ